MAEGLYLDELHQDRGYKIGRALVGEGALVVDSHRRSRIVVDLDQMDGHTEIVLVVTLMLLARTRNPFEP